MCANKVVLEEFESIVQLLAGILRDYQISAEEIEANVETIRSSGYAALRQSTVYGAPVVTSESLNQSCLNTRSVMVRAGTPISDQSIAAIRLEEEYGVKIQETHRDGVSIKDPPSDFMIQPGDGLVLSGTAEAFAKIAPLFRTGLKEEVKQAPLASLPRPDRHGIDREEIIKLKIDPKSTNCTHLDRTYGVTPSAKGCEECLRMGDDWVHLRICMTCGHVGCCDDSKNKHASRHYHETDHPIIRSLEPGEDWAWCYPDKMVL